MINELAMEKKGLPVGWELKKMSDLFDIKSSKRVHKADWKENGVPFYRAREVVKLAEYDTVDNALFISEELYEEFIKEKGAPKEGDIIISAVGTLGKCYLVKSSDRFYFKDASVLWFENISNVDTRYIEFAFKSDEIMKQVMNKSMGATVGTLTISRAKIIEIPLPPLPEQKQIVAILDNAFAAIDTAKANAQQNLKNAKELFDSYLQNLLENNVSFETVSEINSAENLIVSLSNAKSRLISENKLMDKKDKHVYPVQNIPFEIHKDWLWCHLSDISIIQEGPGIRKYQYKSEGIQFLTVTNILEGSVDLNKSKKYISKSEYTNKYEHFTINKGDIVTACSGGSWGKSAVYNLDDKIILNTSTLRLRFYNDLGCNKYLYYLTKTAYFKNNLSSHLTGQQPNYGYSHYSKIPIPVPPLIKQQHIARKLDILLCQTKKLEAMYIQKIADLEEMKKSVLQKAFSGQLKTIN